MPTQASMVDIVQDPIALAAAGRAELPEPANTPWGPVAAVLLCLLPIALLLLVTLSRRLLLPSSTSLPLAAVMMAVIRLAYLSSPPLSVMASVVHGVLDSATPLSVIYGAILLFEVMQHTKCLSWMMSQVKSLSAGEPLAEVFLIGWAFSYMISGVGGFNTPIALSAPMLSSLGHDPMLSLMVVVVLNTLASHMGSVGMAIWFGFKTLDLGQANILLIGLKSSIIVGVMSFLIAPISASFLVPWRQLMRRSLFVSLSIMSAVVPTALVAMFNAEFPVLIGGMCSMIVTTLLIYFRIGLGPRSDVCLSEVPAVVKTGTETADLGVLGVGSNKHSSSRRAFWQSTLKCIWAHLCRLLFPYIPGLRGRHDDDVLLVTVSHSAAAAQYQNNNNFKLAGDDAADGGTPQDIETGSSRLGTAAAVKSTNVAAAAAAAAQKDQVVTEGIVDLHPELATVSCPVDRHHIIHPWDDSDDAESDSVSNPIGGLGCEGLWEDNHSAVMTALPASLVAATIHHASLSGVSRVPWFAGVGTGLVQAAAAVLGQQQQQQQSSSVSRDQQQQQENSNAVSGTEDSCSHSSCEIHAAATAAEAGLKPPMQHLDLAYELMPPDLDDASPHPAAAAAAAMGSKFADQYQKHRQLQHEQRQHQWWQTLLRLSQHKHHHKKTKKKSKSGLPAFKDIFWRTLPIWLTVLLLMLTRIPQLKIQGALQSTHPSVTLQLGSLGSLSLSPSLVIQLNQLFTLQGVNWKYEVLYVPCLLPFVVASLVTMTVHRSNMQEQQISWTVPFVHAAQKMKGTVPAIIGAMVLSDLISSGGVGSPAFIIGHQLSTWLGRGYLAVAGFLGALGSFVSGSVMAGNMTFGAIQKVAAERMGVSVTSMLAVQTAGSCAGKMMCISNILSAKIMMHLQSMKEGKIIRRTAPMMVLFLLLSQALGLLFTMGGVLPDTPFK